MGIKKQNKNIDEYKKRAEETENESAPRSFLTYLT
jgi:hypothetical protein